MGTSSSKPSTPASAPVVPPNADVDGGGEGPPPEPRRFYQFRKELGQYFGGDSEQLSKAVSSYVSRGLGGSGSATRRMGAATHAGGQLLGVISGNIPLSIQDEDGNAEELTLDELEGRTSEEVKRAIVDATCPNAGAPEDEAIRNAMQQALSKCLEDDDFDQDSLSGENLAVLLTEYLTEVLLARLELDSGQALEKAGSFEELAERENAMREYLRATVDAKVGVSLRDDVTQLSPRRLESLVRKIIRSTFEDFE